MKNIVLKQWCFKTVRGGGWIILLLALLFRIFGFIYTFTIIRLKKKNLAYNNIDNKCSRHPPTPPRRYATVLNDEHQINFESKKLNEHCEKNDVHLNNEGN